MEPLRAVMLTFGSRLPRGLRNHPHIYAGCYTYAVKPGTTRTDAGSYPRGVRLAAGIRLP